MRYSILLTLLLLSNSLFSQASFNGNISEMETKNALKNVKLMVVENSDTTYFTPDSEGNFNFKTKPGRVKIFAIADGYISELNSVNAGDGSTNRVDISLVKEGEFSELKSGVFGEDSVRYELDKFSSAPSTSSKVEEVSVSAYKIKSEVKIDRSSKAKYRLVSDGAEKESISYAPVETIGYEGKPVNAVKAGVLTAGEVNDFSKWKLWNDLNASEFAQYSSSWKLKLTDRFCVQLSLASGMPVIDAEVELMDHTGKSIWNARTDNTGKAELWNLSEEISNKSNYSVKVVYGNFTQEFKRIHSFEKGINPFVLDVPCTVPDQLDIAFVVDATGSMGDEINYLKMDLDSVISQITEENKNINLRMASVFYRDKGDDYLTVESPFSSSTDLAKNFIRSNHADGGGDAPEAADEALLVALQKLNWSSSSRARILFWLLDAPPHQEQENMDKIQQVIHLAAKMGVKIVPVGCSGINKPTEFLCRSIALATNGTYTFLTNHSGVGGSHIEPSTDGYKVESFRDVLVRISRLMSITPDCSEFIAQNQIDAIDTNLRVDNPYGINDTAHVNKTIDSSLVANEIEILAYPNPTNGIINIKHHNSIKELFFADVNGKLLEKVELTMNRIDTSDLSKYTSGIYFLRYYNGQQWKCLRIVLEH